MAKTENEVELTQVLQNAITDLANLSPDRKTYDRLTTVMFQLYAGNTMGLTYGATELLSMVQQTWKEARKAKLKRLGIHIVK